MICYDHFYEKMFAGTDEGSLFVIPMKAESNEIEEEEEKDGD